MDLDPSFESDSSIVYTSSTAGVVVPRSLVDDLTDDELEKTVHRGIRRTPDTPSELTRLVPYTDEPRSYSGSGLLDRATLLAVLFDRVGHFEFRHDDVVRDTPKTARIPVLVVAEGKAATACYLAVHGLSNSEIADNLDVGPRTVSQYISDFRKGGR
jgi:hypothetical protein